ncbi:MAG: single-stranded-DNA-specific exonuclease RecJ [Clostridia bacterium]|nr:single-stranded-DNA-specific exonuclease RecJ [Clostridia bacterium]
MSYKKWVVGTPDREFAKQMAFELDIDPFTALIANSRGIDDYAELEYFLSNEPLLSSPREMKDIDKAADVINEAINSGIKIAIFGDYDCDGVMATAIMYKYLVSRNADVITYIPDRINEGYGMNCSAIDVLNSKGVKLIITVDNGIAANKEISYAASLGIVTVVSDHHLPPSELPDASAVVDPHRLDCPSSFKEICGAQVAFNLICVIEDKEPEEMLDKYADLLSIAIIGDFMPLIGENRSIVKYGINQIKRNSNTGISTVLSLAGIDRNLLDSSKISFGIAPRINAAGRMGSAERALNLVTETNISAVLSIANEIESDNISRQKIEKDILQAAIKTIEDNGYKHNRVIVVSGEGYHLGVIGIVAARICEKYGRPAIVLSSDGDMAHGSGRSIGGFHIYNALSAVSECLVKFGGHELAAGVSLEPRNIDNFRNAINDYALAVDRAVPMLHLDFRINPSALSLEMVDAIKCLEPFGNNNPTPVFGAFGVKIERISPIGQGKHLKLVLSKNGNSFMALLFGKTLDKFPFCIGDTVDIAVNIDKNFYKNEETLSVIIKAIRLSGIEDDDLFNEVFAVDDYISNGTIKSILLPSREDIGLVYNKIKAETVSEDKLITAFLKTVGFAKTNIALIILTELGLIKNESGNLSLLTAQKTDLMNSKTYKRLCEAGEK